MNEDEGCLLETLWDNKDKPEKIVVDGVMNVCRHLVNGQCSIVVPCDTSCNLKSCNAVNGMGLNEHGFAILMENCKERFDGLCCKLVNRYDRLNPDNLFLKCENVVSRGECRVVNAISKTFPRPR